MAVYVLLLRAIGPATHSRMSMAALREALTAVGLGDVSTIGNTGNVLCRSDETAIAVRDLAQSVVEGFGVGPGCEVFVRTSSQMARVISADPFPDAAADHPARVGVCSFHTTPRWPVAIQKHHGPERLATVGAHLVVDYPTATGGLAVEKIVGARMTQRNWRVFARLAEKAAALAEG